LAPRGNVEFAVNLRSFLYFPEYSEESNVSSPENLECLWSIRAVCSAHCDPP